MILFSWEEIKESGENIAGEGERLAMVWPIDLIVENVYIDGVDELSLASYGHRWLKVDLRAWMQCN